jgi:hypothetical protein
MMAAQKAAHSVGPMADQTAVQLVGQWVARKAAQTARQKAAHSAVPMVPQRASRMAVR